MADPNSPVTRFQNWRRGLPPALRVLLTINVVAFLALIAISVVGLAGFVLEWMALSGNAGTVLTRPWTLLTYGFLNPIGGQVIWGLISFIFALAWLTWIGRDLEYTYGSHQLLGLYLLATLTGGLLAALVGWGPSFFAGAWAPVGAVVVAAGVLHPRESLNLWLLGAISMKWIAIAFVTLDFLSTWLQAQYLDLSHVGAYGFGVVFALAQKRGVELGAWTRILLRGQGAEADPMTAYRASQGGFGGMGRGGGADDEGEAWKKATKPSRRTARRPTTTSRRPSAPTQADIDRILDKIHEKGLDSLSAEERKVLEKWSGALARRRSKTLPPRHVLPSGVGCWRVCCGC
ncbi:MAG: rhomboid family intramembrane serine protease [Bacteroidota bacterium]